MGGQAAEQIIAGVVLSERLAVTTYGAIHRAQFNGQRNLRGLVIDSKFLDDDQFRQTITDSHVIDSVTRLDHPNIVPTFTVESNGPDVVVVTRGVGRYVTVQDLITSAKSRQKQGGRLATPIAGLIGRSVVEALAHAHEHGVVHGAVHPRSVIIDEDGAIRLDNFVSGRALTTAVAAGADSALWRGHGGYIAPELVVGEDPTPGTDVFAVGALLFAMLTGEAPPGNLRATPAVERLVQRALDTDAKRRYRSATELLENLIEALEDDRWDLADRGELIREAGLLGGETNIDDATEDLLASLGSAAVSVTPTRPSMDMRAAASVARQKSPNNNQQTTGGRLDSLLADLGDDHTGVDDSPFQRDPVSELINLDPRKREMIVSSTRVPSLDDPDDDTPLPAPAPEPELVSARTRQNNPTMPARPASADEAAALAAIGQLDIGARPVSTAAEQAAAAAAKLEQVAVRAEQAAKRVESGGQPVVKRKQAAPVQAIIVDDLPTPKLKSPLRGVFGGLVVVGVLGAAGYGVYTRFQQDDAQAVAAKEQKERAAKEADEKSAKAREAQPDPGALEVNADGAGIWLRLGRTPLETSIRLPANQQHDLVLLHDGNEPTEAQINGPSWSGRQGQAQGDGRGHAQSG